MTARDEKFNLKKWRGKFIYIPSRFHLVFSLELSVMGFAYLKVIITKELVFYFPAD